MGATRRLFMTVGEGAVLFTVASWALVWAVGPVTPEAFRSHISLPAETILLFVIVFVPDGLAAWWIFRRLLVDHQRSDARRGVMAFAVSAPVVLAVGMVLGELVGGYAEVILGSHFILPAVAAFVMVLMIFGPSAVVVWALHPSGGVGLVGESDQDEHR